WEKARSGVRLLYANRAEVVHKSGNGVWFYGAAGKIYVNRGKFELWRGEELKTKPDAKLKDELDRIEREYLADAKLRLYKSDDHKGDWLSCIRSRKRPICDVEVGAHTVIVCHLVNLAYYHGQKMKWDPNKEQFTDGTGDKNWLEVSYREPWKLS